MIASTFWKNTIPLCTGCDQSTACSSSWCAAKLPAVWKNFFGTIGARSVTSASGEALAGLRDAAPPRSKNSRVDAQSSSTRSRRPVTPDPTIVEGHQLHRRLLPGALESVHERDHRVVPRGRYAGQPALRGDPAVEHVAPRCADAPGRPAASTACGRGRPRSPPRPSLPGP